MNRYALRASSGFLVALIVLGLLPGSALAAAPVAVNDPTNPVIEDVTTTLDVLLNDSDPDSDPLTITDTTNGSKGTVSIVAGPAVSYNPNLNANGTDSFTYTISDGNGGTATATVTVQISAVNDRPVANPDPINPIDEDVTTTLDVLANDSDPDVGDTFAITGHTNGSKGTVTPINAGSAVSYNPNANATGTDSFTYTISDGNLTATATVTVQISAVNDPPVAVNDPTNPVIEDVTTTLNPLANDTDPDGDSLTITGTSGVDLGVVTITSNGTRLSYDPTANANGNDGFTYTISDGNGGTATATVTVQISAVNDRPDAVDDLNIPITRDSAATPILVLANDTDIENDTLTITAKTSATKGTVAITGGGTGITYDPYTGIMGTDSFTYTISDGHGGTDTATVSVNITGDNRLPNAVNDVGFSVPEGAGPTSLAVLANDDDPDGDPLTIIVRTNGAHGTVAITGGGTGLTYDPVSLYHGTDSFTYTISDGQGGTDTATVVVTVTKDATDPVVAVPVERLLGGTVATTSLKTRLAWSASDPGSGIKSYQLQVSVNGRTFATLALPSPTRTYLDQALSDGVRYRYRVRATDREGNVSAWRYTATFKPARFQESTALATYTGAWANYKTTRALGGAVRYTSTLGRAVSFRYTVYDVALVMTKTASSGSADIYVDGVFISRINLRASSTTYRQLVFARHFTTLGAHTIEVRPTGSGRVDIDAFAVLR